MDFLIYLVYPLIIFILLWKAKIADKGSFFDDYLSLSQAKCIQGFCLVMIMLHHCSQKLCEPGSVPEQFVKHGLEPFLGIGYLMVAIFFFCSGYGLYKSCQNKENYFDDFFFKRLIPIVLVFGITTYCFMYAIIDQGINITVDGPMTLMGPTTWNPYAWYVYAIIICYSLFYLGFKYFKNDRISIGIIIGGLVLYIAFCSYWLYGGWWYNTVLIFPFGIIYAKHEDTIKARLSDGYGKNLIGLIIFTIILYYLSDLFEGVVYSGDSASGFARGLLVLAILRTIVSMEFVLVVIAISLKVKIGNPVLKFLGKFTLEFYLLHGLFVQIFASRFLTGYDISVMYIVNPFLYVLVVFILTCICGYIGMLGINLLYGWIRKELRGLYGKSLIWTGIIILLVIILVTIKTVREDIIITEERSAEYTEFVDSQDKVSVDGGRMAYFVQGEGEHTIVLLGSSVEPSSELILRYMTNYLSKDNKVVIFDILGKGFSDDTYKERSAENIANEIHEALEKLQFDDKYILMPCEYSGTYALKYLELYREDVEAVVGIDMALPSQYEAMVAVSGLRESAYDEVMNKDCNNAVITQKLLAKTGYSRWMFKMYEMYWGRSVLEPFTTVIEEVYVDGIERCSNIEERRLFGNNCKSIDLEELPQDLPVLLLLDYCTNQIEAGEITYRSTYDEYISNPDIQQIIVMEGDPYFIYYKGGEIARMVRNFIKDVM